MTDRVVIGQISGGQGLQGEVKIRSYAEDPRRFSSLTKLYVEGEEEPRRILSVRYKGVTPILRLEGVEDRTAADALRFRQVAMDAEELPELPPGQHYVRDLLGFAVESEEGQRLGSLKDIRTETAQPLYVVEREGKSELLIPGVPAFILERRMEEKKIVVRLPEGLQEL